MFKRKLKSFRIEFLLLSILVFPIGCKNDTQKKTFTKENQKLDSRVNIPKVFFKKFTGELADNRIINLYLTRNANVKEDDSSLNCVVDDSNTDVPVNLSGTFLPNHSFKFESDEGVIVLTGNFISDSKIRIKYSDPKTKKVLNIELIESRETISITPVNYYSEFLQRNTGDSSCDSTTAYVNIDLLHFNSQNNELSKKINSTIKEALSLKENQTYEESVKTSLPNVGGYESSRINIVYFENNFLTIQQDNWEAACGAAHGDYNVSFINYDIEANEVIHLEDIFKKNYVGKIEGICKTKFKEKYKLSNDDLKDFQLPKDLAVLRNGILFVLQPYNDAIHIYTGGAIEVFIPFSEVRSLMNIKTRLTN